MCLCVTCDSGASLRRRLGLRQLPVGCNSHATARAALRRRGVVVVTTIHKFFPEKKGDRHPTLSDLRNSKSSPTSFGTLYRRSNSVAVIGQRCRVREAISAATCSGRSQFGQWPVSS